MMFACGGYPDITVGMIYISFVYEYSLEEVQGENAREKTLKKLEHYYEMLLLLHHPNTFHLKLQEVYSANPPLS